MPQAESPAVSVIVPFFNSERHLVECIESLLDQEEVGGPYEVILIDNGSRDGSPRIVERYPELIVLDEPTSGAYAARNAGIRQARAPLIAFTDADCVAAADWLRSIRSGMEDRSAAILLGHCSYPEEAHLGVRLLEAYENSKTHYVTRCCPSPFWFGYANNMAVRSDLFAEHGLFKEWRRAADTELVQRLARLHPDLRPLYLPTMRITHMEFVRARNRMQRMRLYSQTNSRIDSFRELGPGQRLGVLWQLMQDLRVHR